MRLLILLDDIKIINSSIGDSITYRFNYNSITLVKPFPYDDSFYKKWPFNTIQNKEKLKKFDGIIVESIIEDFSPIDSSPIVIFDINNIRNNIINEILK
jgi:hypothetical protein